MWQPRRALKKSFLRTMLVVKSGSFTLVAREMVQPYNGQGVQHVLFDRCSWASVLMLVLFGTEQELYAAICFT